MAPADRALLLDAVRAVARELPRVVLEDLCDRIERLAPDATLSQRRAVAEGLGGAYAREVALALVARWDAARVAPQAFACAPPDRCAPGSRCGPPAGQRPTAGECAQLWAAYERLGGGRAADPARRADVLARCGDSDRAVLRCVRVALTACRGRLDGPCGREALAVCVQRARTLAAQRAGVCARLIADVRAGRLAADAAGVATLRGALATTSRDGTAWVIRRANGRVWVLLPWARGHCAEMAALLCGDGAFAAGDLRRAHDGSTAIDLPVRGPAAICRVVPPRADETHAFTVFDRLDARSLLVAW